MRSAATFTPRHVDPILREPAPVLMDCADALTKWTGKRYAVLCSSGSAALYMAMLIFRDEDLAMIPSSTFPAMKEAQYIADVGMPIFVDAALETWHSQFPPDQGMLCPVHNYGCVSPYPNRSDHVVVDAAAALLTPNAFVGDGPFCVSFNWNKSISGGGGGAILTDDATIADALEGLKRHKGQGAFNFQLPALCAAEVFNEMQTATDRQAHLRNLSLAYDLELERVGLQAYPRGTCRWLTGTMLSDAAKVARALRALSDAGYCGRRAWTPLADSAVCPNAWTIYERGIILPGGYGISVDDVREVCGIVGRV
jgi:dTDP-4-amino-4,6-dideoxygalactose transaminase